MPSDGPRSKPPLDRKRQLARPALRAATLRDRPLLARRARRWRAAGRAGVRRDRAPPARTARRARCRAPAGARPAISASSSAMPSPRSPSATTPFHAPHRNRPASRASSARASPASIAAWILASNSAIELVDPGADARPLLGVDVGSVGLDAVEGEEAKRARVLDVEAQVGVAAGDDLLERRPLAAGRRCAGSRRRARRARSTTAR